MGRVALLTGSLMLVSCGWLPNHYLDYRQAGSIKRMEVPPDMVFIGEQALFPIPEGPSPEYDEDEDFQVPEPPVLAAVAAVDAGEEAADGVAARAGFDPENTRVLMARDGNGYPIIMMHTAFTWAWEHVGQALGQTELKVEDRDRESGLFYVTTPKKYQVEGNEAQVKLSHTANGIQITVLNRRGTALLDREPGLQIIQALYDKL